jgi:predicted permease
MGRDRLIEDFMEHLFRDIRYALRQWNKSPGFALTAVLTLAFGIGAATTIFSIVEGMLLRPLPFAEPGALFTLGDRLEGVNYGGQSAGVTAMGVRIHLRDNHAFSSLGGYRTLAYELFRGGDTSAQINAARLTAGVFPTLGVSPFLGRVFTEEEDESSRQVAVLSYQTWRNRFHSNPQVLGQKILLDRKPYEIIGVMPRDFEFPLVPGQLNRSELWTPMSFTQTELVQIAGNWAYSIVGRLRPGITAAQAQQDATSAVKEITNILPPALSGRRLDPEVISLDEETVSQARPLIRTLFLAVLVVLFIACANLAALLLVRVIRRRGENSIRLALGADRAAVIRQNLVESLVLSMTGGLFGLTLTAAALRLGIRLLPETLPRISSISLDWRVAFFALVLAVLTGLFCGLIPALDAARTGVNEALKESGRTGSRGRNHVRLRYALVVSELAVTLVLLTSSGLLLRSFEKMRSVSLGFRSDHVQTAAFSLPRQQYSSQASIDAFNFRLQQRLQLLSGVQAVGATTMLPASGVGGLATFTPEGYMSPQGESLHLAWMPQVTGDYLQAQGIAILRGRDFTSADRDGAPLVAIINRSLAEHYWPGQDPIGKRLHRGPREAAAPWVTIIGEIEGVRQFADHPSQEEIFIPSNQARAVMGSLAASSMLTGASGSIVIRGQMPTEQMANSLQTAVRSIDPMLPLTQIESMDQVVSESQAPRRFNTAVISAFAGAALALALLGAYGVVAFSAAMRKQEMAIRLALGSERSDIMRLILASGLRLGLAGSGVGIVGTLFATRLLRSLVFEVDVLDPAILVFATFIIILVAILASVWPARRAASVEPMEALRSN